MQEITDDYYAILGVEEQATPDDIRKAYLKLAKRLHPDRYPNDPEKKAAAQQDFARVTRAHEVLGDARQKEEYDAIRLLSRNRAALDLGSPAAAALAASGGISQTIAMAAQEQSSRDSKESWAAKHSQRAKECSERKRYQEAETAVKEAIRLDPNKVKYHCQLAEVYVARGWKTLALTEVQTALRLDPNDAEAKQLELKMKASTSKTNAADKNKGGFLDSISKLLGKK